NQLRVTEVLSESVIREYARDLAARADAYRRLIETGRLELTQNTSFETFERTLADVNLARLVNEEPGLAATGLRERNLKLMERLNPGRIFRIAMPVTKLAARWVEQLTPADRTRLDAGRRLELLNQLLPTRLWLSEVPRDVGSGLDDLVRHAPATST